MNSGFVDEREVHPEKINFDLKTLLIYHDPCVAEKEILKG